MGRKKIDPLGTEPLPLRIAESTQSQEKQRKKYVKPAGYGNCPRCTASKVALLRQGDHFVWKEHTYATWGRARFTCQASGVTVCELAEATPAFHYGQPAECPHPRKFS